MTKMKEWLREHPEHLSDPRDADPHRKNSRQLLAHLKRSGWQAEETADQIRLFPRGRTSTQAVEDVLGEAETMDEEESLEGAEFGLEAQLRDFIAHNVKSIPFGSKSLKLHIGENGHSGIEFPTGVGPIDILAVDEEGSFVVFELKLGRGPDKALGQLARYMGWVKAHLSPTSDVRGVIVARSIDEKLRYAAKVVPNVLLMEYTVRFDLKEAAPIVVSVSG